MQSRAYFDHNATTPLAGEVAAAFTAALREVYGNASSIHQEGQAAKRALESARREIAGLIGAGPKQIVLLSGGTEANNLALSACESGTHVVTTSIEHPAVLGPCARLEQAGVAVTYVAPACNGCVPVEAIRDALRPETRLISVMHANNETGVVQPVAEIGTLARERGIRFHIDGVQAAGKLFIDVEALGCDYYSLSAHKLYAPKGVGALYVKAGAPVNAQLLGGHQERDRRAGTENVPAVAAFGAAARLARGNYPDNLRLADLRDRLERGILASTPDAWVNGAGADRLPNTTNIGFAGVEGEAMVIALDLRGFAVSSGSACSSGAVEPSHVLLAMGLSREDARSSVRFSLGQSNTTEQVEALVEAVAASITQLRRVSATYTHA